MEKTNQKILEIAFTRFEEITGQSAEIKKEVAVTKDKLADAVIRIPKLNANLYAEIKYNVTNQTLGTIVQKLRTTNVRRKNILITRYITPQLAEKLKEMDIQFLDTAGNVYINLPHILLFIKGNSTKEAFVREKPVRAFQPAGLKLIYALLCVPGLENKPYRAMANMANIANGAVTWAIMDLKKLGYIVDMGKKGRRLKRKKELLQRWVNSYAELLRPKLLIGRYKTESMDWWNQQNLANMDALYGGETAAALLTKYLKPQNHTIYVKENKGKVLLQLKLKNDPAGNVEILNRFWNFDDPSYDNTNLVNPVLIYADLLATGENRNIETAKMIYENEVIRYIGED